MPSTESLTETSTQTPEETLQQALERRENVKRLLSLEAVDSFDASFDLEKRLMDQQSKADHEAVYGGDGAAKQESADVGNKYLVAGNMTVTEAAPAQPASSTATAAVATAAKSNPLAAAALAASLLAGGSGVGYILNDVLNGDKQPAASVQDTDTDSVVELTFPE